MVEDSGEGGGVKVGIGVGEIVGSAVPSSDGSTMGALVDATESGCEIVVGPSGGNSATSGSINVFCSCGFATVTITGGGKVASTSSDTTWLAATPSGLASSLVADRSPQADNDTNISSSARRERLARLIRLADQENDGEVIALRIRNPLVRRQWS